MPYFPHAHKPAPNTCPHIQTPEYRPVINANRLKSPDNKIRAANYRTQPAANSGLNKQAKASNRT